MPDRQPTFQEAAFGFSPYYLRAEFEPFVDEWKAGPPQDDLKIEAPNPEKHRIFKLAEALMRRAKGVRPQKSGAEPPRAEEQQTPYNQMVEYAAGAVALGRHYNCGDAVLEFLKEQAFQRDQRTLAYKFDTDVRIKILRKQDQTRAKDILDYETITAIMAEVSTRVNQTLSFGHKVRKAQQEAEKHYRTGKFQRELAAMLKYAARIENRIEAHDLEGHLCSPRMECIAPSKLSPLNAVLTRVRRPGANELLAELAKTEHRNQIFLWTGLSQKSADAMITRCGLIIPPHIKIYYRENTQQTLESSIPFQQQFLANKHLLSDHDREEVEMGRRKFVGYNPMGVELDYLYDDFAAMHLTAARTVCNIGEEEARKYYQSQPFWITTETDLERHHEDRGLFSMMQNAI